MDDKLPLTRRLELLAKYTLDENVAKILREAASALLSATAQAKELQQLLRAKVDVLETKALSEMRERYESQLSTAEATAGAFARDCVEAVSGTQKPFRDTSTQYDNGWDDACGEISSVLHAKIANLNPRVSALVERQATLEKVYRAARQYCDGKMLEGIDALDLVEAIQEADSLSTTGGGG